MSALPSAVTPRADAAPAPMWRARVDLWCWRHGLWVPLIGLLVAAAAWFAWDTQRLQRLSLSATKSPAAVQLSPSAADALATQAAARLQALRGVLTPQSESTQSVRRLVRITQPELAWQQAQFQQSEDAGLGLVRLQITVPVQGRYRQMRASVNRALLDMPNLSLDQVMLRREHAGNTELEAQLRFSLWMVSDRGVLPTSGTKR
jgi:hypothetical protein